MQVFKVATAPRKLHVVALPIGNLKELSPRALTALSAADLIVCEDTRVTGTILKANGLKKELLSNQGSREHEVAKQVIAAITGGKRVALVSDAGYPALSDPGAIVVKDAYEAGLAVEVINGPSSVMHALVVSGFSLDSFFFAGFLPSRSRERYETLKELSTNQATVIVFEAPHRIMASLADIAALMPDRQIAVCRELTKLHETIYKGLASDIGSVVLARGEFAIVFEPVKGVPRSLSAEEALEAVGQLVSQGIRPKDACKLVADGTSLTSKEIYGLFISQKNL